MNQTRPASAGLYSFFNIGKDMISRSFFYISRNETRRAVKVRRQPFYLVFFEKNVYIVLALHVSIAVKPGR